MEKCICEKKCYGCTACKFVCPKNAIDMVENDKGFLVAKKDEKKCNNCELCKKVCSIKAERNRIQELYIVKHKNNFQHLSSQSGGAFTAISDYVLNEGGAIYGVVYNEKFEAEHVRAVNKEERDLMHGSKYIQSNLKNTFELIKTDLNEKKVLFIGTPCQVAGLKKYLKYFNISKKNLYTVDLICHGTPSVRIWRKMLENVVKNVGTLKTVIFRDKQQTGWGGSKSTFYGSKKVSNDYFCRMFFTDLCLICF